MLGYSIAQLQVPEYLRRMIRPGYALWPLLCLLPCAAQALPERLILFLDGVSYRDVKALQQGVTGPDGRFRQCFERYFPATRVISTYPSASDVASTDIFGNRPLPGYQRTYYSHAANSKMFVSALTSAMEFERQMDWILPRGCPYTMSFVAPIRAFRREVPELVRSFLAAPAGKKEFYAYMTSTDNAQHLSRDILQLLDVLDPEIEALRAAYRAREGRELEVLMFSDHGNNHTPAQRVKVRSFLKQAGYRLSNRIASPRDVVLPTAGVESWVEIHNDPSHTERLLTILTRLEGVDILTAQAPGDPARFIVMNSKGDRASIDWRQSRNAFRYKVETGDPLGYGPVVEKLTHAGLLDEGGFGEAEVWLGETAAHFYPVALERIVRGHTRVTLNPASIILSLQTNYVHANFWIKLGSRLVNCAGTHGGLNHLDSTGFLLSSFAPTIDTTTHRLADLYGGFEGLRDYRQQETGAELFSPGAQALAAIARGAMGRDFKSLNSNALYLRVWTPLFSQPGLDSTLRVSLRPVRDLRPMHIRRGDPGPGGLWQPLALAGPVSFPATGHDRVYALPGTPALQPGTAYLLSGQMGPERARIFEFQFRTDARGRPVPY